MARVMHRVLYGVDPNNFVQMDKAREHPELQVLVRQLLHFDAYIHTTAVYTDSGLARRVHRCLTP